MQVPAARIVTVVPETEQMPDVAVVNATIKDDVDVAERDDGLVPKVISAGSVKVIDWLNFAVAGNSAVIIPEFAEWVTELAPTTVKKLAETPERV